MPQKKEAAMSRWFAVVAVASAFALIGPLAGTGPAKAAKLPSWAKKRGADYGNVRDKLLSKRWIPVAHSGKDCPSSDDRCTLGEAVSCSGTGLGFCNMQWENDDGTVIEIITTGETEADLTVYSARKR
jgi:hypothetical protein